MAEAPRRRGWNGSPLEIQNQRDPRYEADELWELFQTICTRVIARFQTGPISIGPRGCEYTVSRSSNYQVSISRSSQTGNMSQFNIQVSTANTFVDSGDKSFEFPPQVQFNGTVTPVGIALQVALMPLAFGTLDMGAGESIVGGLMGFYDPLNDPKPSGPFRFVPEAFREGPK